MPMRAPFLPLTILLGLAAPAAAQVSINLDALEQPGSTKPVPARPAQTRKPAAAQPAKPAPPHPATPTGAAALALPTAPPAPPVLPPPPAAAAPSPPPRPATLASAGSTTASLASGLRVIFAAGKSDLTPESAAALTRFATAAPTGENVSFNVAAYATGVPEDLSIARRLSLSRALAIRAALIADGISSTRIYVRALGAPPAAAALLPADRVDITILGANAANAPPARP